MPPPSSGRTGTGSPCVAPDLEATSGALKTQTEDWTTKHFAVRETQNGLGIADENLINVVRTAHAVILDDVRHNHRSPRFLTYFPRGLVAFTRASYLDQLTAVRSLAQRCAQDPSPKVQEQAGLLEAAADQMDAAFAPRFSLFVVSSSLPDRPCERYLRRCGCSAARP